METKNRKVARAAFGGLCAALDRRGWNYTKFPDELRVTFSVEAEDNPVPMQFGIMAEEGPMRFIAVSTLPFNVQTSEEVAAMVLAVCMATNKLQHGSFKFDVDNNTTTYVMTSTFGESQLGEGYFERIIDTPCDEVSSVNKELFALAKGIMDIVEFIQFVNEQL